MQELIKPLLAKDVAEDKLKFPLWLFCKIDGVYLLVQNGKAYGRSLKQHENKFITKQYSNPDFEGLRGELIAGDDPTAEGLVRSTASACSTIEGEPSTTLWCFDYVTPETINLSYAERYNLLKLKVKELSAKGYSDIFCIAYKEVHCFDDYHNTIGKYMELGFEGAIIRDFSLKHKEGRSSSVKPHLWRWKPWLDAEILVTAIEEGSTNTNEAEVNELGRTKRSFKQEGLVPNWQVANIIGTLLDDLKDYSGKVIMKKGSTCTVSPGELPVKDRKYYFENQSEIIGKIAKFRYFAYDLKDKPRYPTFVTLRSEVDL